MIWWNKKSDTSKFTKTVHLVFNDQFKEIFMHPTMKSDSASGTTTNSGRQVKAPDYYARRSSRLSFDDENDSYYAES